MQKQNIVNKRIELENIEEVTKILLRRQEQQAKINGIENLNLIIAETTIKVPATKTRKVKVIATKGLNWRKGAGLNFAVVKAYNYGATLEIIEESNGWGRTADGWVCLDYVK
mgnify:CR=1 FL=1